MEGGRIHSAPRDRHAGEGARAVGGHQGQGKGGQGHHTQADARRHPPHGPGARGAPQKIGSRCGKIGLRLAGAGKARSTRFREEVAEVRGVANPARARPRSRCTPSSEICSSRCVNLARKIGVDAEKRTGRCHAPVRAAVRGRRGFCSPRAGKNSEPILTRRDGCAVGMTRRSRWRKK